MKLVSLVSGSLPLKILLPFVLYLIMPGCYVDVPPRAPEVVSIQLSELLADSDPEVRRTAAEALGKVGQSAAHSGLIAALKDEDHRVRAAAALSLGSVGDGVNGMALVEHLADSAEPVRAASALALGETEVSAASEEQILKALQHPQSSTRVAASRALLSLDTVSFSADIVSGLRDSNANVRQGVAAVLGETGDARALPYLLKLLNSDPDAGVRSEAAFRLGKIGDDRVLGELSAVAARDSDMTVREWARWAGRQIMPTREFGSGTRPSQ